MKPIYRLLRFGRLALAAGALALSASAASAQVLTTYQVGDIFIGFRQTGVANTLVAKIGTVADYLPTSLGGSRAPNSTYNPTFGVIPSTVTPVTNLNADLTSVFGAGWNTNATDGTSVRWGIVGWTGSAAETSPVSGLTTRSLFVTRARTNPSTQTTITGTPSAIGSRSNFGTAFGSGFIAGGIGSYPNQNSTLNSSVAYIGAASDTNNWGSRINNNGTGSFGLGATNPVEQQLSGAFQGPTDSVLDLWLSPNTSSTLVTQNTYLGSFSLSNSGQLTFTAVPEPSTYALLALAGAALVVFRRRKQFQS